MTASGWLFDALHHAATDATAIEAESETLSYGQLLDRVTDAAASFGKSLGDAPVVALVATRGSPKTIVRLLALWTMGRVPLLLSAESAPQRIAALADRVGAAIVGPDDEVDLAPRGPVADIAECPDPAYIISTSGSTGDPNLVLCRWAGLELVVPQLAARYHMDPESRVLQFASASYDAYLAETIPVLFAGGTVVCCDSGRWSTPRRVVETICRQRVTHATFPPSYLAELLKVDLPFRLHSLVSAGETLDPQLARRAARACTHLINAYGPCEATICATTYEIIGSEASVVPIGTPLQGVGLAVRGGALDIKGASVAWGYVGGIHGTGFSNDGSESCFRTADAVEVRNGVFVHLGRVDRRRKIVGQLVDLGNIEETLRSMVGVDAVAAVDRDGEVGVIIVTTRPIADVQAEARSRLTGASYPQHWALVAGIPRLDSDKLDLTQAVALFDRSTTPRSERAKGWLQELWQLRVAHADVTGDFFAQGGTSLTAMELLDDIYEHTGTEIDLADFLEKPTFANLADLTGLPCDG